MTEGISDKDGKFICAYDNAAQTDSFGHKMLTGSGKVLESFIRNRYGVKVRSVELNVPQRDVYKRQGLLVLCPRILGSGQECSAILYLVQVSLFLAF